jgi:hypothetical protein
MDSDGQTVPRTSHKYGSASSEPSELFRSRDIARPGRNSLRASTMVMLGNNNYYKKLKFGLSLYIPRIFDGTDQEKYYSEWKRSRIESKPYDTRFIMIY